MLCKNIGTCTRPELMASTRDFGLKARICLLADLRKKLDLGLRRRKNESTSQLVIFRAFLISPEKKHSETSKVYQQSV